MAAKGGAIPQEGAGIRQKRLPGLQELTVSSMNMRNSPERNRQEVRGLGRRCGCLKQN